MPFLRKYGTGTGADIIIPMIKRAVVDFAVTGDWTPATGDVKVSLDGATPANIGTLPVINGTYGWKFVFSDAELQCKTLRVTVVDSATKAVEDQMFLVETFGHASAMYPVDLSLANLTANVINIEGSDATNQIANTVLAALNNISVAQIWDALLTGITTNGSIGKLIKDTAPFLDAPVSSRSSHTALSVWDVLTAAIVSSGTIGEQVKGNLNATVSSRSSHSAADVKTALEANGTSLLDQIADTLGTGGAVKVIIDAIKAKTDNLAFSSGLLQVVVHDLITAALAKFATTDTGETTAASGSVAELSQGAGGGGGGGDVTVAAFTAAAIAQLTGLNLRPLSYLDETLGLMTLVQGDDYHATDGRNIAFSQAAAEIWGNITGASAVKMYFTRTGETTVENDGTVVTGGGSGQQVSFNLAPAKTNITAGEWKFFVQVTLSSGRIVTIRRGKLFIIQDEV